MNKHSYAYLAIFLGAVLLYNAHALFQSNVVSNVMEDGYQKVVIDMRDGVIDTRNIQRCCINLIYAGLFLVLCWNSARSFGVIVAFSWFSIQAYEVYATGNYFFKDWPDWIILQQLLIIWWGWEKWRPPILRIIHSKWRG